MADGKKIKMAFGRVRKDMDRIRYESSNANRYFQMKVDELSFRITELERRLSQIERWSVCENLNEPNL